MKTIWDYTIFRWVVIGLTVGLPVGYFWLVAKATTNASETKTSDNLRFKKGIDTLYDNDSVYVIHFVIDSVYKAAYEPLDPNDRDY